MYCLRIWTAAYPHRRNYWGPLNCPVLKNTWRTVWQEEVQLALLNYSYIYFFLTCLFLLDFILDNIPEVFMTKILCTWLLTLEKSLFLKRSLDGWHGWPQRKGRNFIQKSKEKDMKEKAKRKGKREFEYASHRPIEFTFYLYWVTWGTVLNAAVKLQGAF